MSIRKNLNKSTHLATRNTSPICYVLCYRALIIIKMTPQDKAKELVKQFYNFVSGWTSTNRPDENPSAQYEGEEMKIGRAKQCALIAVDEIIDEIKIDRRIDWLHERKGGEEFVVYWYAVRDSLNAL